MIQLPRTLAPWASQLALFPKEMALALGPLVARLSNLLGAWRIHQASEGAPDGLDGIARRGPYDRLLATEWLLLDEVPDEFLRRAVSAEHLFLHRAHQQKTQGKRCIALFDSGIEQLGAPRIAHLAMLILLAQRADRHDALFEWGILQDPQDQPHLDVTEASVLKLLSGRCTRQASRDDIDRWKAALDLHTASEVWLVGSEQLADEATRLGVSILVVEDVLEPGLPQRIRVQAISPTQTLAREAVLEVPPVQNAVKLLRNPFAISVASRQATELRFNRGSQMVFSSDGSRLYVRGANSTLISVKVPNSPHMFPGLPAVFAPPEGHVILAVGRSPKKNRTMVLTQNANDLVIHVLSRRETMAIAKDTFIHSESSTLPRATVSCPLRPLGILRGETCCFVHDQGELIELPKNVTVDIVLRKGEPTIRFLVRDTAYPLHIKVFRDSLAYAKFEGDKLEIRRVSATEGGDLQNEWSSSVSYLPEDAGRGGFYFGAGNTELKAYSVSPTTWMIAHQRDRIKIDVPEGCCVVGAIERAPDPTNDVLVVLNETRTRIELLQQHSRETLVTSATPVQHVAISNSGRDIAYLTADGELVVYSRLRDEVVLRVTSGITS